MQLLMAVMAQQFRTSRSERGQSTVEYIMVTFAAGTLAYALINVMGVVGKITGLLDKVVTQVLGMF